MRSFRAICLILYILISAVNCFYKEKWTHILEPPKLPPDSYFGYSMAYWNEKLVISAPASDYFGQVFAFNLAGGVTNIKYQLKSDNVTEKTWFGATIRSFNSYMVVCAPRHYIVNRIGKITQGQCFLYSDKNNGDLLADMAPEERIYFNGGMDTFGWSVDLNENSILVGSPAISSLIKIYDEDPLYRTRFLPYDANDSFNFGYYIISGNFLSETETNYAVSSTYGDSGYGKVIIFNERYKKAVELLGDEVGSLYGAVLCKANLGTKRASLLVGAPVSSDRNGYDRGAVYIYMPTDKAQNLYLARIIKGTVVGGYFGYAIASLGDLDGDQKDEIAIAAPYEDGRGSVYIYTGAGLLEGREWKQKIQPAASQNFGISIVPIENHFENGCNGLAISALLSDRTYIYECNPSINVDLNAYFPNIQERSNQTYFTFKIVIKVDFPEKPKRISSKLVVQVKLTHPSVKLVNALTDGSVIYNISLYDKLSSDQVKEIQATTANDGNYDQSIEWRVDVRLENEAEDDGNRVLLSERSVLTKEGMLSAGICAPCVHSWKVDIETRLSDPYIVGSSDKEKFSLVVKNPGVAARGTCAITVMVYGARFLCPPLGCAFDNDDLIICRPPHQLLTGQIWNTGSIEIEMNSLSSVDDFIKFSYGVYDGCNKETKEGKYKKSVALLTVTLHYDRSLNITGVAMPNNIINITNVDDEPISLQHQYMITNNGVTNWVNVSCEISLQKKKYLSYSKKFVMVQKGSSIKECLLREVKSSEDVFIVSCNVDLQKNDVIRLFICIEVLPNVLKESKEQNVILPSELTVILREKPIKYSVETKLILIELSVPAWVIIISLIIALLILLLIGLILYKKGCFERKAKKELKNLKIKQESIRKGTCDVGERYKPLQENEDNK